VTFSSDGSMSSKSSWKDGNQRWADSNCYGGALEAPCTCPSGEGQLCRRANACCRPKPATGDQLRIFPAGPPWMTVLRRPT
jgi:hypothetical protein